jgi:two-component system response regulator CpxR
VRPKKVILLIDSNEVTQSTTRFFLETRGYRVLSADTPEEGALLTDRVEAILMRVRTHSSIINSQSLALKDAFPEARLLLVSARRDRSDEEMQADGFLWDQAPLTEWLDYIRLFCARKRGPKKPVVSVTRAAYFEQIRRIA